MSAQHDELYRLIEKLCTAKQITRLLRSVKGNEGVRITATDKKELVHHNLKRAIESNALDLSRAHDLLRRAEENGNHHTFYWKVRRQSTQDSLHFDEVAYTLWGSKWKETTGFPKMKAEPESFMCSDFRRWDSHRKPRDWVLKVYGHQTYEKFTGAIKMEGDKLYKEFVRENLRIVLLVRWNSPDILELRVQRDNSRKRLLGWVAELWTVLKPIVNEQDFVKWDLSKARKKLLNEHQKHKGKYQFRDARVVDSSDVHGSFEARSNQGNLFDSEEATDALQSMVDGNGKCTHASILWNPTKDGALSDEVRVLIGGGTEYPHEVVFMGQAEAGDVDYVTEQLRQFNR